MFEGRKVSDRIDRYYVRFYRGRENVKSETLSSSGLPAREIPRGTQHAGKGISQPVITLRLSAKMKSSA